MQQICSQFAAIDPVTISKTIKQVRRKATLQHRHMSSSEVFILQLIMRKKISAEDGQRILERVRDQKAIVVNDILGQLDQLEELDGHYPPDTMELLEELKTALEDVWQELTDTGKDLLAAMNQTNARG